MSASQEGKLSASELLQREGLTYSASKVSWATADFLAEPSPLASRIFIYVLMAFLISSAVYARFSQVAISVDAHGSLVTEQAVFPIRPELSLKVSKLNVKENQKVKAGDVLLVSEDQISEQDYAKIAKQVGVLKDILAKDKAGNCPDCLPALNRLADVAFDVKNNGVIREKLAAVQGQIRELTTAENQVVNFSSITANTARQIKVAEGKLREIKKRKAQEMLAVQVEQLTGDVVSGHAALAERKQTLGTMIQQARDRLGVSLGGILAEVDQYRSQNTVVAPITGIVTQLKISGPGQLISPGQDVLSIVPSDSIFVGELNVENRDISKIKQGMAVKIKLDALSEREYGSVSGSVQTVPVNVSGTDAQAVYKVLVHLDRQSLIKNGTEYPFRLGMTLNGSVITRYESLLQVGIRKLFNIKEDLFKD